MMHKEVRAREKFRFRTRILFYSGLAGLSLWWLLVFTGISDSSDYWSALGGLAIVFGILGTYVGAPLMIRAQYGAEEPTPWRIPAIVAGAYFALLIALGFITLSSPVFNLISFILVFLFPLSIYMAIWSIVVAIQQKRAGKSGGEIDDGVLDS